MNKLRNLGLDYPDGRVNNEYIHSANGGGENSTFTGFTKD